MIVVTVIVVFLQRTGAALQLYSAFSLFSPPIAFNLTLLDFLFYLTLKLDLGSNFTLYFALGGRDSFLLYHLKY